MEGLATDEDENRGRGRCRINRKFIPLKMIYFFFMAGESCALLYRSIFMKHLGMSAGQTGIIWTLERIVSVLLPPFIGAVTDKTRKPKLVLTVLLVGGGFVVFSMYLIPQEEYIPSGYNSPLSREDIRIGNTSFCSEIICNSTADRESYCELGDARTDRKHCHPETINFTSIGCGLAIQISLKRNSTSALNRDSKDTSNSSQNTSKCTFITSENNFTSTTITLSIRDTKTSNFTRNESAVYGVNEGDVILFCVDHGATANATNCDEMIPNPDDEYGVTFWLLTILIFLATFTAIGSYPVLEATVLGILGPSKRHKFGQQRLWASVGFGSAALIVGFLIDKAAESVEASDHSNREFLSMFVGVLICWTCAAIVASRLPIRAAKKSARFRFRDIKQVLIRPKAVAFFALLLFYGADNAVQEIYLFWLAEQKLNASKSILGASTFAGAILDIPFCLMSGRLVKRFGHICCLCFGMLVYALRLILYVVITEPWQLIFVECLRCITWGLTYVTICSYTAKLSPKGLEVSTMGLTQGIMWGVGYSGGALLGGVLFQSFKGDVMFISFGLATVCAVVLFGIFSFFTRETEKKKETTDEDEKSIKFETPDEEANDANAARSHISTD